MSDYKDSVERIIEVATSMINGEMNLIEGCRIISSLRHSTDNPNDGVFDVFVGVDSETDGYPLGKVREKFSPEYLQQLDADVKRYLEEDAIIIIQSCREILEKFSK